MFPHSHPAPGLPADLAFLAGGGEMGERIRAFDWSTTPLGAAAEWPLSLRTTVRIMLASRQPVWIGWGSELIYLYNDPYRDIIGGRHPTALGKPTREVWPEIWDVIGPMLATAMHGLEWTYVEEQLLIMERHGYPEETYYTFSYTPVPDDRGETGGIICANSDDTQRVLGERRLAALGSIADETGGARDAVEACRAAAAILERQTLDVAFALIYLLEPAAAEARLAATVRLAPGCAWAPERVNLADGATEEKSWPFARALRGERVVVEGLATAAALPGGAWPEPAHTAVVLPLARSAHETPAGLVVLGTSPRRAFDESYQGFMELVATGIAGAVAKARALEEERRRAEALAEIDRAKTAFFSNVSHEFRTPLTLMLAPLEELLEQRETGLPTEAIDMLQMVNRNGLRLLRLVNTLLDFSRIEAERVQASYAPTDLAAYTADLASVFRSACERAGLRLTVDCEPLPEPVWVDCEMWEKIVLNLVSNAFKFTFEGVIAVTVRSVDGWAELRVRDTGVGVPAEEVPRLFERFHRVEATRSRTHEGSGIGLALVQELVRLHGGSVRAESKPGAGTTFIVAVPLGTEHLPAERLASQRSHSTGGAGAAPFVQEALRWLPEGGPNEAVDKSRPDARAVAAHEASGGAPAKPQPRVLIADDNADMREYLARLLSEQYAVETVADGEAALSAIHERMPDLLLSDVMMPRLDGAELVRRLRQEDATRTIPIILLSARAGEDARVEGLATGADDYVVKPFSARELIARVESHLKLAQVRAEAEGRVAEILGSITDGFHTVDAKGRFRQFNAAARAMYAIQGMDADALLGRDLFEVFPETVGTPGGDAIRRTLMERVPTAAESFFPTWRRWYALRNFPLPDGGVATFFADITERKGAEETLRESEERYRATFENAAVGIAHVGLDGRWLRFNDTVCKITGYTREELERKTFGDITHPDDLEADWRAAHRLMAGETATYRMEKRYVRPNGAIFWANLTVSLLRDAAGAPLHFLTILEDIDARKQAEAARAAAEDRLRLFIEHAPAAIAMFDREMRYLAASARWKEDYQIEGELAGLAHYELFPDLPDPWRDAHQRGLAGEVLRADEDPFPRADGSMQWIKWEIRPWRNFDGEVGGILIFAEEITARKLAAESLRLTRQRAELVSEAAEVGFWFCDLPFDVLQWDARVKEHFWLPPDAVVTIQNFYEQIHPEDGERTRAAIGQSIENRTRYDIEYRTVGPDGAVKWIRAIGRAFYNEAGQPIRFDGVTLDTSDRKRIEATLNESRERLQASLDAASAGTFRWNLQGNALEWDENLDRLFGLPPGRTVRSLENFVAMVHPDERAEVIERCQRCALEGADFAMEFRVVWPDGTIHWLDDKGRTFFDEEGRPLYMTGACVEITSRKTMEAALREQLDLTRSITDNSSQAIFMTDERGFCTFMNPGAEAMFGLTLEEFRTRSLHEILHHHHPDGRAYPEEECPIHRVHAGNFDIREHEDFFIRKDGEFFPVLVATSPIFDKSGERVSTVIEVRDITERKRAENALQRAAEEAQAANRAKDNFLAALSHELRTPLTPVLMTAAALMEDERLPDGVRDELAMIERNIALEARLIDDLLDLTRIAKGLLELRRQPCDAHSLIALAVEIVRDDAQAKGINIQQDFTAERTGLRADPTRFQQVIWNLLRNAVKFTPERGRIAIRTRDAAGKDGSHRLRIEVEDTGAGISAGALERIFAPFEQAGANGGHRFGGLGLGLAIARAIVDLHGGAIWAESAGLGAGATFVVELPDVSDPPAGLVPLAAEPGAGVVREAESVPLRLLLVEDHEPTLRVLSRLLERDGHQLTVASSVAAAHAAAAAERPDLVISDLGLPDGTGIELMQSLRDLYGLTGVALSGYGMEDDLARSRAAGFVAHLVKPVDFAQLRRALREAAGALTAQKED